MKCEKELALLREAIRKGRKNKKITQEELAEKLDISRQAVSVVSSCGGSPLVSRWLAAARSRARAW